MKSADKSEDSRGEEQSPDLLAMIADPKEITSVAPTAVSLALMARRPSSVLLLAIGPPLLALAALALGLPLASLASALPLVVLGWLHQATWVQVREAAEVTGGTPPCSRWSSFVRGWPLAALAIALPWLLPRVSSSGLPILREGFFIGISTAIVVGVGSVVVPLLYLEQSPRRSLPGALVRALTWIPPEELRVWAWRRVGTKRSVFMLPLQLGAVLLVLGAFLVFEGAQPGELWTSLVSLSLASVGLLGVQSIVGSSLMNFVTWKSVEDGRSPLLPGDGRPAALPPGDVHPGPAP
jgi:hypothetical protein